MDGVFALPAALAFGLRHGQACIATRFDTIAVRYQATVTIAAINEWLLPDA